MRGGFVPSPHDVGEILAGAAGLVSYGHEQGAVHGDLTLDTVRAEPGAGGWRVELSQPRAGAGTGTTAADDIRGLGEVLRELTRDLSPDELPPMLPAALASMVGPAQGRPTAAQVRQYFAEDYPGTITERPGEARTEVIPVAAATSPAGHPSSLDDVDGGYTDPEPARYDKVPGHEGDPVEERRSGVAAIVVSALVLLLGLGALGFIALQLLGQEDDPVAVVDRTAPTEESEAPDPDAVPATGEATEDETETEETTAEETDEVAVEEETVEEPDTSTEATSSGSTPTGTGSSGGTASGLPAHVVPGWEDAGWDVQALDEAYCRGEQRFVGLADTETYRGVICAAASNYVYRGLNKAANATTTSMDVVPADSGWEVEGESGVRYLFDDADFTIVDGSGDVLDEEPVTTWLTPDQRPFRPGDLDLSQPISYPPCDGSGVVVLESFVDAPASDVQRALDRTPGSFYIRTDLSCDNFNRPSEGTTGGSYIYAVLTYGGNDDVSLCSSVSDLEAAYGYYLRDDVPPGEPVDCS